MATGTPRPSAPTTAVAMTATSAQLAATGTAGGPSVRYVSNTSGQILYMRFGSGTASATDWTIQLANGAVWENAAPFYAGAIQGVLATGTGNVNVTVY